MRTKHNAVVLAEQKIARERTEAFHDARALAIEVARGEPSTCFDPMTAGVVLRPGATAYRQVPLWIRALQNGCWAGANRSAGLGTDMRRLRRVPTGRGARGADGAGG